MIRSEEVKSALALLFVALVVTGFIRGGSINEIGRVAEYLSQSSSVPNNKMLTLDILENEYASDLWIKKDLIEINGAIVKQLGMRGRYSDMDMYVTENDYIVSGSPFTKTDYEFEQTVSFKEFLNNNGINMLYVNEPTKYLDDSLFIHSFGVETYSNRNMDTFLSRLRSAGVNVLDLRESIQQENLDIFSMFYRTDHHWTTKAGLWATGKIAEGMNNCCGYQIDPFFFDLSNYNVTEWKNCWLGEQGRKLAQSFIGLDDYSEIKPAYLTSFTFKQKDGTTYAGSFDEFINEWVYNLDNDVYENRSWHYSYSQLNCINQNVDYGKVLLIGDSYAQVTEPFLALGVHEIDSLILRSCEESFNLRDYIINNGYDTVLICYAQFMLGAHDNPNSANYRMFTFE